MLICEINVAKWFHIKSPSLARCKEGDLPLFEHWTFATWHVWECAHVIGFRGQLKKLYMEASETAERNSTKLDRKSSWSEKQDGHLGLWLAETFSTSSLKPLNGIQRNLTGSKISMSSTKSVFLGPMGNWRWLPLIGWYIFDFSSETAEWNSKKLDKKQNLNVLYQVYVFSGRSVNQVGRPSLWLAETFSHSSL